MPIPASRRRRVSPDGVSPMLPDPGRLLAASCSRPSHGAKSLQTHDLGQLPVVLCGDFNGKPAGRVYSHIVDRGFKCSYEDALGPSADRSRWVSHRNHLGEELGVDYIWLRNPGEGSGSMEPEWDRFVYQVRR